MRAISGGGRVNLNFFFSFLTNAFHLHRASGGKRLSVPEWPEPFHPLHQPERGREQKRAMNI